MSRRASLQAVRARIAAIEAGAAPARGVLPFGDPRVDQALPGGGLPLGAFLGPRRILATLAERPPLAHVTTFGGHPLSCAAGLAALEVVVRRDLPARACTRGAEFLRGLDHLRERHRAVRTVRGLGLLLAIELRTATAARSFAAACLTRGLVLNWTLHRDTVIRLAPPLTITRAEIACALGIMDAALSARESCSTRAFSSPMTTRTDRRESVQSRADRGKRSDDRRRHS